MQENSKNLGVSLAGSNLGHDFDPLREPLLSNPYPFFARARQEEPIFFCPLRKMTIVTRYADVRVILKDEHLFSLPLPTTDALLTHYTPEAIKCFEKSILGTTPGKAFSDPMHHSRLRKALTSVFAPRQITNFEPQVRGIMHHLIDQLEHKRKLDFIADFAHHYPLLILGKLLGIPSKDITQVSNWIKDWINLLFLRIPSEKQLMCAQSLLLLQQYLYDFLALRCINPQNDLATALLKALEQNQTHHLIHDAIELIIVLFVAGFEITENFLGLCLFQMLSQERYWQSLQEDRDLIAPVIEEMLRFDSSGGALIRRTTQEVVLSGVSLSSQTMLYLALGSANHDESQFSSPEIFDPYREYLKRHIAFGYGSHYCIGATLARLETRIALEVLSRRLKNLRLLSSQLLTYKRNSTSLRGLEHLFIEWDPF